VKKADEGHHVQAEELLSQSLYLQHFPSSLQNDPEKQHTYKYITTHAHQAIFFARK